MTSASPVDPKGGIAFVDHTPVKNAIFVPEDGPVAAAAPTLGAADPAPDGFFGRIAWHYTNIKNYKEEKLRTLKPWSEFFDRSKFSTPGKMEAFSRANKNLAYFSSNYVVVATVMSAYVLITNLMFLIAALISIGFYYYCRMKSTAGEPITIRGKELSTTQAYTGLVVFSVFMFFYTDGSSTVFWLLTCAVVSVLGHAVAREPVAETNSFSFV